jgi:hypothetical protein
VRSKATDAVNKCNKKISYEVLRNAIETPMKLNMVWMRERGVNVSSIEREIN